MAIKLGVQKTSETPSQIKAIVTILSTVIIPNPISFFLAPNISSQAFAVLNLNPNTWSASASLSNSSLDSGLYKYIIPAVFSLGSNVPGPGSIGPIGPIGPIGATGSQGVRGIAGAAGAAGAVGPVGPNGPQGADGHVGQVGPQGIQGDTGPSGTNKILIESPYTVNASVQDKMLVALSGMVYYPADRSNSSRVPAVGVYDNGFITASGPFYGAGSFTSDTLLILGSNGSYSTSFPSSGEYFQTVGNSISTTDVWINLGSIILL